MNRSLQRFPAYARMLRRTGLAALLALSAAHALAANTKYTNKTFLMPRPAGVNLPMEYPTLEQLKSRRIGDSFGGNFQSSYFFQRSEDAKNIATYFLFKNKESITLTKTDAADDTLSTAEDLDLGYIIHDNADAADRSAKISFSPERTAWGATIDYYQDLSKIMRGLYCYGHAPFVEVESNLKMRIVSADSFADDTIAPTGTTPAVKEVLEKYFSGNFENKETGNNRQATLTHAKIAGKQREVGIADIDLGLGYKMWDKETWGISTALALTIPTGNQVKGIYLFEPIVGNGKHFGLGGDLNGFGRLWGDLYHNVKVHLMAKYRYLFEHNEKRTLGINGRNWGQYHLLITANAGANAQLTPAANILTQNVDVTPGSQFDGILGFAYNRGGLCFDAGYNLYYRAMETVKLRDAFTAEKYAIVARNASTLANVNPLVPATDITDGGPDQGAQSILSQDSLDINGAATPQQTTHALYANVGGVLTAWGNKLMLGLGGTYEWPDTNSALEEWNVHFKMGIGF